MPPKYVDEDGTVQGLIRSVNVASGDSSLVVPPSQAFMVLGNLLAKTHPPIQSSTSYSEDAFSTDSFSTLSPIGASVHSVQPTPDTNKDSLKRQRAASIERTSEDDLPSVSKQRRIVSAQEAALSNVDTENALVPSEPVSVQPDWRALLSSLVDAAPEVEDSTLIENASSARQILKHLASLGKPAPPQKKDPEWKVLHRLRCESTVLSSFTLDTHPPYLYGIRSHLATRNTVTNLDLYIERNQHASFIVFREYSCCSKRYPASVNSVPDPHSEKLVILSKDLLRVLNEVKQQTPNSEMLYPEFALRTEIDRAHLWTYFGMEILEKMSIDMQPGAEQNELILFLSYFRDEKKAQHGQIQELLASGLITLNLLEYLFVPSMLLIQRDKRGWKFEQSIKQISWPIINYDWSTDNSQHYTDNQTLTKKEERTCEVSFEVKTLFWQFDSNFQETIRKLEVSQNFFENTPFAISDLPVYPLRFAQEKIRAAIAERGNTFWKCRRRRYVEYSGHDYHMKEHEARSRCMIDMATLRQNTPDNHKKVGLKDQLGPEVMANDNPPEGDFIMLLPSAIPGYHMKDKKWRKLLVSNIHDVVWDQSVFDTLVLPQDTKDLIMALVTNKIDAQQSTDFFQGKGNGLVLLFHGAPGTGKTLTAESVAELAKKPLYRVTCGDIGTKPEEVEQYLNRVLYLGKVWDCVVLLDEAEVFLQERATNDIQRNALVSVFLRALEYYDGILVLTSNRVGTFDEGFKSRIQLALHYERLTHSSRERVWENFLNRLESFQSVDIDVRDLRRHLKELANFEMNGRQIRNAVTTGRQLAMYQGKPLDFDCMRHVINVSSRFDQYLIRMNEGLDDEDVAREERLR